MAKIDVTLWLTASLTMIVLAIAIFVRLGRTAHRPRPRGGSQLRVLAAVTAWLLLLFGLFGLSAFTGVGILVWALALVILAMAASQHRIRRSNMLLWSLSLASRYGIPLTTSTAALARQDPAMVGTGIQDFGQALSAGAPLGDALLEAGQLKSDESRVLVSTGDHFDRAADALREAVKLNAIQVPLRNILWARLFYLFFVGVIMLGIWTFMFWKIVPAFNKIFDDFELELPTLTKVVINISYWMVNYGFIFAIPLGILLLVVVVSLLLQYMGWASFRIPLLDRVGFPLQRAVILQCLAIVTRHGKSLTDALCWLAEIYPQKYVRHRLQKTAAAVQSGAPWHEAMCRYRLLRRTEAALLDAAARVGNLSWAMGETADAAIRRYYRRTQAIVQALALAILLALGFFGSIFAAGMFLPLVRLMQACS